MSVIDTFHMGTPYLSDKHDRTRPSLLAVLVRAEHSSEHFCAYLGIVDLPGPEHRLYDKTRALKATQVAMRGNKLNLAQAQGFFPGHGLDKENYIR